MPSFPSASAAASFLILLMAAASVLGAEPDPALARPAPLVVAVGDDFVEFRFLDGAPAEARVLEVDPWLVFDPAQEHPLAWSGSTAGATPRIPRVGPRAQDRLYRQFALVDAATGEPAGAAQFATDLSAISARTNPLLFPEEIKGLTTVVVKEDALEAGIAHANSGLVQSALIDWSNPAPTMVHAVDGVPIPINAETVRQFDETYSGWTEHGVLFTPIPINMVPREREPGNYLIHPWTDLEATPFGLGAFNMTDAAGTRAFIAMVEFLVERYTRPEAEHGQIAALIIGNELQAHWTWHNMGDAPEEVVLREYTLSLRLADLAARSIHRDFRVYNSMTHHWSIRGYLDDPLREISGIDLLDGILAQGKLQGDFPWHVAFHPYPENLFEAAFWNDRTATMRFDSPRVTFKNIEVLGAWLLQDHYLWNGEPRRIMFSEQGFHIKPDDPESDDIAAAAYALAYTRSRQLPMLDAFHLHRHAHHPDEGGLRLGIVDAGPLPDGSWEVQHRHRIWDVFQAAGTPRQEEAFAFALPIIGIASWDEAALDFDGVVREMRLHDAAGSLFDLVALSREARLEGFDRLFYEEVIRDGGFPARAIFQHPPVEGGDGRVVFELDLPPMQDGDGRDLVLLFDTAMKTDLSDDGVEYRIEIDGEEVFSRRQSTMPLVPARIDLRPWAGRPVELVLITNRIESAAHDWSLWVQPRIVWE